MSEPMYQKAHNILRNIFRTFNSDEDRNVVFVQKSPRFVHSNAARSRMLTTLGFTHVFVKTLTIKKHGQLHLNKTNTPNQFLFVGGTLCIAVSHFDKHSCKVLSPHTVWHLVPEKTWRIHNISNASLRVHLATAHSAGTERKRLGRELFIIDKNWASKDETRTKYQSLCRGSELLVYALLTKRPACTLHLSNVRNRGYARKMITPDWVNRYNHADIQYPAIAVEVHHPNENSFTYICRDGNRRVIKRRRLGLDEGPFYVFSEEEEAHVAQMTASGRLPKIHPAFQI